MAITLRGELGTNTTTGAASLAITTAGTSALIGDWITVEVSKDNVATTDTDTTEASVTDSAGNTYSRLKEHCNGNGSATAGVVNGIYAAPVTAALAAGGTITVTFSDSSVGAARATCWTSNGSGITSAGTAQAEVDDSGVGSLAITGLSSRQRLWLRSTAAIASQANSEYSAVSSGFTAWAAVASGGGGSRGIVGEYIIATATGQTSAPTLDGGAADTASVMVCLEETSQYAGSVAGMMGMF
jgi:hypothetical protein